MFNSNPIAPLQIHAQQIESQSNALRVTDLSTLEIMAGIFWKANECSYFDWRYLPRVDRWRELLPPDLGIDLTDLQCGDRIARAFAPGELVPPCDLVRKQTLKSTQFYHYPETLPALGRYYPVDCFSGIPNDYHAENGLVRIAEISDQGFSIDANHPLCDKQIELSLRVEKIGEEKMEHDNHGNSITTLLCNRGPGMQDSLPEGPNGVSSPHGFERTDATDDGTFFSEADLLPYWDARANAVVAGLYRDLIPDDVTILDLMAGAHSPLISSTVQPRSVTCAGLNPVELDHNTLCNACHVVNVNDPAPLPYADSVFDVVLIHAAIEYVIRPIDLFSDVARVIKPGGRCIITFSNRSVDAKVVNIWKRLYEFERPALVLNYFRSTGVFENLSCFSLYGLDRPQDDRLAHQFIHSDPVFAAWADKTHK